MHLPEEGYRLCVYIGESDRHNGKPLYEWLVLQAREQGLAGATVLRGVMGFGANTRVIHTFKIEQLSADMPMVIEIVDTKEKLEKFLEVVGDHLQAGLVTLENLQIRFYKADKK